MKFPRIVLAGTQSGVGKTTLSIGIMAALKKRGFSLQPYKVGPDYIDPSFHSFVTGNKSRNLDSWMLPEKEIQYLFGKNAMDKDLAIIEGVMGLYDGHGSQGHQGSTAHVSKILRSPVILIINGSGMAASAAAQVLGYKLYDREVDIQGVIINQVSGEKHYQILKDAIERDVRIPCIGYMVKNSKVELKSRHLGLIPTVELDGLQSKIDQVAEMVEKTIDLDAIVEIASKAEKIHYEGTHNLFRGSPVNLGVAMDEAFHFYYEDNLELLRELGANLIFFSPLRDAKLPENLQGLYIGGGFPEVFGEQLQGNKGMRESIHQAVREGLPTYAECGGLMYLTKAIFDLKGQRYEMVGVLETEAKMTEKLQRFGYIDIHIEKGTILSSQPYQTKAHEFHRSRVEENSGLVYAYRVEKHRNGELQDAWKCGLVKENVLAGYGHIHFYSNQSLAKDFVESCRQFKGREREK